MTWPPLLSYCTRRRGIHPSNLGDSPETAGANLTKMHRLPFLLLLALTVIAQTPAELLNDPAVRAAMEAARRNEARTLDQQAGICEIPAPPFHEEKRGLELKRLFEELRLSNVRIDKAGNVIGVRPGKSARPNLVISAHLEDRKSVV